MKTYVIGYDLNRPRGDDDYQDLVDTIKELFPTWWHHLDSTWIVKTDMAAKAIRDALKPYIDSGDELLVVHLSGEGAWQGFADKGSVWLKDHL